MSAGEADIASLAPGNLAPADAKLVLEPAEALKQDDLVHLQEC